MCRGVEKSEERREDPCWGKSLPSKRWSVVSYRLLPMALNSLAMSVDSVFIAAMAPRAIKAAINAYSMRS